MFCYEFFRVDPSYVGADPRTSLVLARRETDPTTGEKLAGVATVGTRQELAEVIETNALFAGVSDAEFCAAFDKLYADVRRETGEAA